MSENQERTNTVKTDISLKSETDKRISAEQELAELKAANARKRTRIKIASIICSVVIVAAVSTYFILRETTDIFDDEIPRGILTEANVRDIQRDIEEKVALGMFETHMNTTWRFPDGRSASSNAIMGNSPSNNFAFWFTLTLPNGDEIYRSGLLPVGTELAEIVLDTVLSAGTYNAVVSINMVQDDGTPVENNMGINVTIIIQS